MSKPFIKAHIKRLFKSLANTVEKQPAAGRQEDSDWRSSMTQCEALLMEESTEVDKTAPAIKH